MHLVLQTIRSLHPHKTITIFARCATVDATIAAASSLKDKHINLILDRGPGSGFKLARSLTVFSLIPIIKNLLLKYFDCGGENKIKQVKGKILFIRATHDQLMTWGQKDLIKNLIKQRGISHKKDQVITLSHSGHWTPWDQKTAKKVYAFLGLKRIHLGSFPKETPPLTAFSRSILPYCIQAWC